MAYKTFVVERTEDESTQTAGPAALNRADVPPLVKVFDDESDIVLSTLATNEIVATKNTDYSAVAVVDRVAKDNLNPVTSNAVANAISYSTDETPTGGHWIDGKPIYRKVVILPTAKKVISTSYTDLGISFPNDADKMLPPKAVSYYNNLLYYNSYKPIQVASRVEITLAAGTEFILEYTKATD